MHRMLKYFNTPTIFNKYNNIYKLNRDITKLALLILSLKGKNASDDKLTPDNLESQSCFSASVSRGGTSSYFDSQVFKSMSLPLT